MDTIRREDYLAALSRYVKSPAVVVITGLRRVGKSVLLRQLAEDLAQDGQVLYVDKEDLSFDAVRTARDLVSWVGRHRNNAVATWVVIDEVQLIQDWELAIASLHGRDGVKVVLSGSNATLLGGELASRLAGRYVSLRVLPLSFAEFTRLYTLKGHAQRTRDELFHLYRKIGGLPGLLHTDLSEDLLVQMQRDVYNTIAFRDVVARHSIRDVGMLEAVTRFAMDSVGNLVSANRITNFLKNQGRKTSLDTVLNYLSYLCEAFVFEQVSRFEIQGRRHLEVGFKYYLGDISLRSGIMGSRQQWIGGDLENLVLHELVRRGYQVSIGSIGTYEIDFVANRADMCIYVQVAYLLESPETVAREVRALLAVPDAHPKVIISLDPVKPGDLNGVSHLYALDFLSGAPLT